MTQLCTEAQVTRICGSAQDEQDSGEQSEDMGTVWFDIMLVWVESRHGFDDVRTLVKTGKSGLSLALATGYSWLGKSSRKSYRDLVSASHEAVAALRCIEVYQRHVPPSTLVSSGERTCVGGARD